MKTAYFNSFHILMPLQDAQYATPPGQDATPRVQALLRAPWYSGQFDRINPDFIREELSEYGAWDADELADDQSNRERILWIAAGNIIEENTTQESEA
jgi:hypothetical protein